MPPELRKRKKRCVIEDEVKNRPEKDTTLKKRSLNDSKVEDRSKTIVSSIGQESEEGWSSSDSESEYNPDNEEHADSDAQSDDEDEIVDVEALDTSDSDEEYFDYDKDPLKRFIFNGIKKYIPHITDVELENAVNDVINNADDAMIDAYCGAIPKDAEWKNNVAPENLARLEPLLNDIRANIKNDEPTLDRILDAAITKADKKLAIEYLDILRNTEPFTMDYFHLKRQINNILTQIDNPSLLDTIEKQENEILSNIKHKNSELKLKILSLETSLDNKSKIYEMYQEMMSYPEFSDAYASLKSKVMWAISLPYNKMKIVDIPKDDAAVYCLLVKKSLDNSLYGLEKVKLRILEIVNNRINNPESTASLALCGPPGVGKTTIAKAIAEALQFPFERLTLAGMDLATIKGSNNCYLGASPSILLHLLKRLKYSNPIVLLDEIDKLPPEIQYSVLEITDYAHNNDFRDMFLSEMPHNLSKIWFMFALNETKLLYSAMNSRLDIIELDHYTYNELKNMTMLFLIPRELKRVGLKEGDITLSEEAVKSLLTQFDREIKEMGVRVIEKNLNRLFSRIGLCNTFLGNNDTPNDIRIKNFHGYPYIIHSDVLCSILSTNKNEVWRTFYG